jgi:hypothetical protein
MLEFLKKRFQEELPNIYSQFEKTSYYKYIELVSKNSTQISNDEFSTAINESKFIIITILNSIQNQIRNNYEIELEYNQLIKEKMFIQNEQKIILEILDLINKIIYKEFKFKYSDKQIPIKRIISKSRKNQISIQTEHITSGLKLKKESVCVDTSFIYLSIFEMLNFPKEKLSLATAPTHVFIRYNLFNGNHLNWETVYDKDNLVLDEYYIYEKNREINLKTIKQTTYLTNLNLKEILAFIYHEVSIALERTNDMEKSKEFCFKSYELCENNLEILEQVISKYTNSNEFQKAENLADKISYLNSKSIENHSNITTIYATIRFYIKDEMKRKELEIKISTELNFLLKNKIYSKKSILVFIREYNLENIRL